MENFMSSYYLFWNGDFVCDHRWQIIVLTIAFFLLTGEKLGFNTSNAVVTNEEGAEVDCIEVIRDNDKLFVVEEEEFSRAAAKLYS